MESNHRPLACEANALPLSHAPDRTPSLPWAGLRPAPTTARAPPLRLPNQARSDRSVQAIAEVAEPGHDELVRVQLAVERPAYRCARRDAPRSWQPRPRAPRRCRSCGSRARPALLMMSIAATALPPVASIGSVDQHEAGGQPRRQPRVVARGGGGRPRRAAGRCGRPARAGPVRGSTRACRGRRGAPARRRRRRARCGRRPGQAAWSPCRPRSADRAGLRPRGSG